MLADRQPRILIVTRYRPLNTLGAARDETAQTGSPPKESHTLSLLVLRSGCNRFRQDITTAVIRQSQYRCRLRTDHKGLERRQFSRNGGCGEVPCCMLTSKLNRSEQNADCRSCKSSDQSMNQRHYAIARNSTWPTSSFTFTTLAIRIPSHTFQICGYVLEPSSIDRVADHLSNNTH